jgi:hypothetical protein
VKVPLPMASRNGLMVPQEYAVKRLAIAWAQGGHPEPAFYGSLLQFLLTDSHGRKVFGGIAEHQSCYIENNKNACVRDFLSGPADTLLFVDTDHRYTAEQVYTLIDSLGPDRPIVGGLYFNYWDDGNIYPVWLERGEGGRLQNWTRVQRDTMVEVASVGGGFMAVQRRVFEEMAKVYTEDEDWVWFGRDVENRRQLGDDATFCIRAAKLGFKVWGNSHVIVDHKKGRWLGWDDFTKHWIDKTPEIAHP